MGESGQQDGVDRATSCWTLQVASDVTFVRKCPIIADLPLTVPCMNEWLFIHASPPWTLLQWDGQCSQFARQWSCRAPAPFHFSSEHLTPTPEQALRWHAGLHWLRWRTEMGTSVILRRQSVHPYYMLQIAAAPRLWWQWHWCVLCCRKQLLMNLRGTSLNVSWELKQGMLIPGFAPCCEVANMSELGFTRWLLASFLGFPMPVSCRGCFHPFVLRLLCAEILI